MSLDEDYANALENEGRDVYKLAKGARPTLYRDREVEQVINSLNRKRSVILVGPPGVGKTALIYKVAQQLRKLHKITTREVSTIQMLAGTRYTGEWQTKATQVIRSAMIAKVVLYFTNIASLPDAGKTSSSEHNLFDAFKPHLLTGELALLGEMTPDILTSMHRVPGFSALFDLVEVHSLSPDQIQAVIHDEARRQVFSLELSAVSVIYSLCDRFMPASSGPGFSLALLAQVRDYHIEKTNKNEPEAVNAAFIEKVFSIYSGLPLFIISPQVVKPASEIREWFRRHLVGQEAAIDAVIETIILYKSGLHDPTKPIGTFLFVGPTGVGKTELARGLATFLFGSPNRLLRFDLSEFKDYHAFEMLLGDPNRPEKPARLLSPVRAQPFQVILFDELEKAHPNVWDIFLQLLDDGRLSAVRGGAVNFRNTLIIATTNVGAAEASKATPGFMPQNSRDGSSRFRETLEQHFRPEFLNRFQHIVYFHALSHLQAIAIAQMELKRILERDGITRRNLMVDVEETVLDQLVKKSYDPRYGARALKRDLQRELILPLASLLMERRVEPGSIFRITSEGGRISVRVIEADDGQAKKPTLARNKLVKKEINRDRAQETLNQLNSDIAKIAQHIDEPGLSKELDRLGELRRTPEFWQDLGNAAQVMQAIENANFTLKRVDRLREQLEELQQQMRSAVRPSAWQLVGSKQQELRQQISCACRELCKLTPLDNCDVLLEMRAVGKTGRGLEFLYTLYRKWAEYRAFRFELVCEPIETKDPIVCWLQGPFAYGYLKLESGLHRFRDEPRHTLVRVQARPMIDAHGDVSRTHPQALKQRGLLGGSIRSRLEIPDIKLILQNERTIAENHELAEKIVASWKQDISAGESLVRTYQSTPFMLKDPLTGINAVRADILKPIKFHDLLSKRIDAQFPSEQ